MKKILFKSITIILFASLLTGCSHNKIDETLSTTSNKSSSSNFDTLSSSISSSEFDLTDERENEEESPINSEIKNQEEVITPNIPNAFNVHDILVPEVPILDTIPFMLANIEEIQALEYKLEKTESTEHANGYYIYWKDKGIVYVTHSSGRDLVSVILSEDGLSLNCGLKIGMTEAEILQLNLTFKKYSREDFLDDSKSIALGTNFIKDEENPLHKEDFDALYVYFGALPNDQMAEYGIHTTSCISIVATIKDGIISNIFLDMPTAG